MVRDCRGIALNGQRYAALELAFVWRIGAYATMA
jgi:hypothetical protein